MTTCKGNLGIQLAVLTQKKRSHRPQLELSGSDSFQRHERKTGERHILTNTRNPKSSPPVEHFSHNPVPGKTPSK